MSSPGYPDFQAGVQLRSVPVLAIPDQVIGGAQVTLLPATPATNFSYFIMGGEVASQNIALQVLFSDASATFSGFGRLYNVGQGGFMYWLPIFANNVTVKAQATGAGGHLEIFAWFTNVSPLGFSIFQSDVAFFQTSGAIGAGGVFDNTFGGYEGPATVSVDASAPNWTLRVQQMSLSGAAVVGDSWAHHESTEFARSFDVWIAPFDTRVRVGNNSAGAQTYTVGVTLKSGGGQG